MLRSIVQHSNYEPLDAYWMHFILLCVSNLQNRISCKNPTSSSSLTTVERRCAALRCTRFDSDSLLTSFLSEILASISFPTRIFSFRRHQRRLRSPTSPPFSSPLRATIFLLFALRYPQALLICGSLRQGKEMSTRPVPRRESPWGLPEGDTREPKAHRCNDRVEDVIQACFEGNPFKTVPGPFKLFWRCMRSKPGEEPTEPFTYLQLDPPRRETEVKLE